MEKTSRRGFLKSLGKTVAAGAVIAATPKIGLAEPTKTERVPEVGEQFDLYFPPKGTCLNCDGEIHIETRLKALYAGFEDGKHTWLIESVIFCPKCRHRITRYEDADMQFIERKE